MLQIRPTSPSSHQFDHVYCLKIKGQITSCFVQLLICILHSQKDATPTHPLALSGPSFPMISLCGRHRLVIANPSTQNTSASFSCFTSLSFLCKVKINVIRNTYITCFSCFFTPISGQFFVVCLKTAFNCKRS